MPFKIAIFASGSGSNAEKIMAYFKEHNDIEVSLLLSNKNSAGVLGRAAKFGIPSIVFSKDQLYRSEVIIEQLASHDIDLIVLAGFLLLIPANLIKTYPDRIVNIHPALLPKYGGKGMYGHHVHQAVFDNKEKESGMTIHLVNEEYDKGKILSQMKVILQVSDTPDIIASKVLKLEHAYYSPSIEAYAKKLMA